MIITDSELDTATVIEPHLLRIDGQVVNGQTQNCWHTLTLYRSAPDGPPIVCHIEYNTDWEEEIDFDILLIAENLDDLRGKLKIHGRGPLEYVRGFPPMPQYETRQANLLQWLRARFCAIGRELIVASRDLVVGPGD